ncbi:uncharacterized protein KZ484_006547 isoform 2-T2 [Pholidichthys leucotaenia]
MRDTKIDQSNQDLTRAHASSDAWIPLSEPSSERLWGTTEEGHDDDSEPWVPLSGLQSFSGAEDSVDYDSEPYSPLSGQQSLSEGAKVCSLHVDCSDSVPRCLTSPLLFEDECSTESEPPFNDEPNCSQVSPNTSNYIHNDLDDSLGSIIGSEEESSLLFEDSPDESVNEESHFGKVGHELENEETLYTGSRLTQAQSFLLILSFVLRHGLTGMALSDLLDLINIHCPENTQLTSKHLFLKELKPIESHLQCHIYCPNCEYYIGEQDSEGQCVVCNTTWDKNNSLKNGNYFIYLPIQTQLEHLLQREDIAHCIKSRDGTCHSEIFDDIGSGKMYRNLNKIGGPLDCTHGYSLTLNCDGVPVFKSSLFGIWDCKRASLPCAQRQCSAFWLVVW